MATDRPLPAAQATSIYYVLVDHAGAWPRGHDNFVDVQTDGYCAEYRFQGDLGFGGKFWNSRRGDWYVTAYEEDVKARPQRAGIIEATNAALAELKAKEDTS
jgi:hypothetical protein